MTHLWQRTSRHGAQNPCNSLITGLPIRLWHTLKPQMFAQFGTESKANLPANSGRFWTPIVLSLTRGQNLDGIWTPTDSHLSIGTIHRSTVRHIEGGEIWVCHAANTFMRDKKEYITALAGASAAHFSMDLIQSLTGISLTARHGWSKDCAFSQLSSRLMFVPMLLWKITTILFSELARTSSPIGRIERWRRAG
jgi:hypothetical protein